MSIAPILAFPQEWAALSLLVAACIYWERAGLTGIGAEGCVLAAMVGLVLGYEWTGSYPAASAIAVGAAMAFGATTAGGILSLGADPAVGTFALSLVPACALTGLTRSGPWRLLNEVPAPGLVRGTSLDGTPAAELFLSPWLLAAPVVILLGALVLLRTPFGLRLRAYGETPALASQEHGRPTAYRVAGAAIGGLFAAGAAALQLRAHPDAPPLGLGLVALGCVIAGRWAFIPGVLLAAGPAIFRAVRPYAGGHFAADMALDAAPFLLALVYLVLFSRRALRLSAPSQARLDPDVL